MLLQAIRDGVVNASIDHTQGWVKSKVSYLLHRMGQSHLVWQ
jgi:hypothetical protein